MSVERKIIGAMIMSKKAMFSKYISSVKSVYFLNKAHRDLYECLISCYQNGYIGDISELNKELKSRKLFNATDTPKLISKCISSRSIVDFQTDIDIKVLKDKFNQNVVKEFTHQTQNKLVSETLLIEKFIEDLNHLQKDLQYDTTTDKTNAELLDEVIAGHDKTKSGVIEGMELGFANLHGEILLEPVDVMVIGARPAMGKTALAISSCRNLAARGFKVALFCIEMSEVQIMRRLISSIAKVDSKKIRYGKCTDQEIEQIRNIKNAEWFKNISIHTGEHSVADISAKASALKHGDGLDMIHVDYLQKVTSSLNHNASETEKVKQVSNDLKKVSQTLEVPMVQYAQLLKASGNDGKRPILSHLKQTGDIEQDASVVAFLHRPEYYGQKELEDGRASTGVCEFIIAKNREGESNKIKEFHVKFWHSDFTGVNHVENTKPKNNKKDDDEPF